jgi:hypothetical protein
MQGPTRIFWADLTACLLQSLLDAVEDDNAVLLLHRIFRDRIVIPRTSGER